MRIFRHKSDERIDKHWERTKTPHNQVLRFYQLPLPSTFLLLIFFSTEILQAHSPPHSRPQHLADAKAVHRKKTREISSTPPRSVVFSQQKTRWDVSGETQDLDGHRVSMSSGRQNLWIDGTLRKKMRNAPNFWLDIKFTRMGTCNFHRELEKWEIFLRWNSELAWEFAKAIKQTPYNCIML